MRIAYYIGVLAAVCAVATLLICTSAEQADARSSVAATAVHHCNVITAASHRSQGLRVLSSAKANEAHRVCSAVHKSSSVLNYFAHKGRWQVAPRYKRWWQVPDQKWRQTVRKSRALIRWHQHKLAALNVRLKKLLPKPRQTAAILQDLRQAAARRSCITSHETNHSARSYSELSSTGKYKGRYQYDDSTWQTALRAAQSYYKRFISSARQANQATPWAQDVVTSFAILHQGPSLMTWDPWQECR